ncbi:sigma-54-dependent Fis family transcriptional regulator, partial [Pseudonocardia abyssalis]
RAEVLTSWRRSRFSGVDPEYVDVPYLETDLDSHFARVAVPIMTGMADLLVGDSSCLALSDASGSVVWRWVSEPMLRTTLDGLSVIEGFCFNEEFVGANGLGTALETGGLTVVRGSEHFVHRFHDVTCVAAPVRHPVTRRVVGAVNVTCRAADTNSLLSVVVRKLVDEIQVALYDSATAREQHLLSAFLDEQRRVGGPVAVVGDGLIIANPQAADLGLDRLDLWDEIRALRGAGDGTSIGLPADLTAQVRIVRDAGAPAGAVITVADQPARPQPARRPVAGAAGDEWEAAAVRARRLAADGPVVVLGEPGSGRRSVLAGAFGDDPEVLDAATHHADPAAWFDRLRTVLSGDAPVVLLHVDLLDTTASAAVTATIAAGPRPAVGLTATAAEDDPAAPQTMRLIDRLAAGSVRLPPLRRRPDAVVAIARSELGRYGGGQTFAADAFAALRRYHWPGNLAELTRVVRDVARDADGPTIALAALPAEVRAAVGRRVLSPIERSEASVIASVLREHDGNKSTAARELGISRTALYAKIRTYRI